MITIAAKKRNLYIKMKNETQIKNLAITPEEYNKVLEVLANLLEWSINTTRKELYNGVNIRVVK